MNLPLRLRLSFEDNLSWAAATLLTLGDYNAPFLCERPRYSYCGIFSRDMGVGGHDDRLSAA